MSLVVEVVEKNIQVQRLPVGTDLICIHFVPHDVASFLSVIPLDQQPTQYYKEVLYDTPQFDGIIMKNQWPYFRSDSKLFSVRADFIVAHDFFAYSETFHDTIAKVEERFNMKSLMPQIQLLVQHRQIDVEGVTWSHDLCEFEQGDLYSSFTASCRLVPSQLVTMMNKVLKDKYTIVNNKIMAAIQRHHTTLFHKLVQRGIAHDHIPTIPLCIIDRHPTSHPESICHDSTKWTPTQFYKAESLTADGGCDNESEIWTTDSIKDIIACQQAYDSPSSEKEDD